MTYEQMRADTGWPDEKLGQYLFDLLMIQEAKLKRIQEQAANQATYKRQRRENRG